MTEITLRCSPDADDLFMMRALLEGLIDTGTYRFTIDTSPTDALNRHASEGPTDVVALSFGHYPAVADTYQLLPHGGSMGEGYGPVVIAREPLSIGDLSGKRVAIPGLTTSAWAVLQMIAPELQPVVIPIVPYARIFDALREGTVDAGLVIHEGRLTYADQGFHSVVDIGEWWSDETGGLPLPLGANTIRRELGETVIGEVSALLFESIRHALEDRESAIEWLIARGSALGTPERVSQYLDMYANHRTLDYGPAGRAGIREFYARAVRAGALAAPPTLDFAP
ncbi:MAG: 1,4-dihydroxy-6-naphthoate synthase [Myxococcota bacterium]|jgi:1,4-dihydroxy-6-naphthoate synthase